MNEKQENETRERATLPDAYFDDIYCVQNDPWNFETSPYETAKYAATLAALPRARYENGFEIGCSIGVLTEQLAHRCARLLSVDVAERALIRAQERCQHLAQVRFARLRVPDEFPAEQFDLIIVSEVGYYLSQGDLLRLRALIVARLSSNAHLLLVHWTPKVPDYPLTGDEVHDTFLEIATPLSSRSISPSVITNLNDELPLHHVHHRRTEKYRLDFFERA